MSLDWLSSPVSEHQIALSRGVWLVVLRTAGFDFRAGMILNVALLALLAALLLRGVARLRGRASAMDAFLPLVVLSLAQHENLLWSMQVLFVLPPLLFGIFLGAVARAGRELPSGLAAGAALFLLPLADLSGLVLSLPLAAWLLAMPLLRPAWRRGRFLRWAAAGGASLLLSAIIRLTTDHPENVPPYEWAAAPRAMLEVLGASLGPATARHFLVWGAALLGFAIAVGASLLRARWRGLIPPLRAEGLLTCLCAALLLPLAIGYGRGMLGPGAGLLTKYTTLSATLLVTLYFALATLGGRGARGASLALLGLALFAQPAAVGNAQRFGETRRAGYARFEADVARGLTADALLARNHKTLLSEVTPEALAWLECLQRHRIGPFARYPEPLRRDTRPRRGEALPLRPFLINDADWKAGAVHVRGGDPYLVFKLAEPREVIAVRVDFEATTQARPLVRLESYWALSGSGSAEFDWWQRSVNASFPPERRRRSVELPVYDKIDLFRIDPEPLASVFRLYGITLVLPAG